MFPVGGAGDFDLAGVATNIVQTFLDHTAFRRKS